MTQNKVNRFKKLRDDLKKSKAFTLIELIVVIAILGVLVLMAAPKFLGYTSEAKDAQMKNDIKAYESAITAKLTQDPNATKNWTPIDKAEMEEFKNENSLFYTKGEIPQDYVLDKTYLDIPEEELKDEVKSKLPGNFIWGSDGKVYYQDENMKVEVKPGENPSEGGTSTETPEEPTPPVEEPVQEPEPVEEPKDPNADDDGDGIVNSWDGDPDNPGKTMNFNVASLLSEGSGLFKLTTSNEMFYLGPNMNGTSGTSQLIPDKGWGVDKTTGRTTTVADWTKVNLPAGVTVKHMELGARATFIIGSNDLLYASGSKMAYKAGGQSMEYSTQFEKVSDLKVKEIGYGYVLYENGDLYIIGGSSDNNSGLDCGSCSLAYQKITSNVETVVANQGGLLNFRIVKKTDGKYYAAGNSTFKKALFEYVNPDNHFSWGDGNINTLQEIKVGTVVDFKEIKSVVSIGSYNTAILMNNGDVYTNSSGTLVKAGSGIAKVFKNANGLMLGTDGNIYGIGENSTGFPFIGEEKKFFSTLEKVEALSDKNVADIVMANRNFILVKTSNGRYFSQGLYSVDSGGESYDVLLDNNAEMKEINLEK